MFILAVDGRENEGAYSVADENGRQVLYMWEDEDDASRYAMLLEEQDYPDMHIIEVDEEMMVDVCEVHGHEYTIITKNDIVIPPNVKNDFI
tara:strand:+ start:1639 stop:1911 length:273 start_codon:yes stop_codon:yes gene_type:complete